MNLSKTEKLLAAKKKLREFQLHKMAQDNSVKQKHSVDFASSQHQSIETNKSDFKTINTLPILEDIGNNTSVSDKNFQSNEIVSEDKIINTQNVINHKNLHSLVEETVKSAKDTVEVKLKSDIENKMELNDFPKVQKEHLLEMASAVADVLTNDSEHTETTLDCDLMCRNQFLSSYLEEQKKIVNELHIELSKSHSRIEELEAKLEAKELEFQAQLARELNPLKEQLQIHTQTTGILIAEKAELTAALSQAQQSNRQSTEETEELMGKLKNSQVHIIELEKEMSVVKASNEELRKNCQLLQNEYESLEKKFLELKKEKEDLNLEASEMKQKLNLKKTELIAVQQELNEKTALLSLSELRIQQMKGTTPTEEEKHVANVLEQELTQTKESLKVVTTEKEEANKQYQNYVKQLDMQQAKLVDEIQKQKQTIETLQSREQSYVQRLSELEQQLQQEREKLENLLPLQARQDEIDNLLRNIDELTLEQEKLHIILSQRDSQIEMLTKDVNDLREVSNNEAEVAKLANALESEQLGASRALHQNRQLKEQLTDMENAFVSLSNAKLDLTEQLQAERSIGRKLNAQLNNIETELEQYKGKLKEKEAILEDLEKEKLQNAQIADQMQHYQAQSHHVDTFQRELQQALITIEKLEKEKQDLIELLKEKNQTSIFSEKNSNVINDDTNESNTIQEINSQELEENNALVPEPIKQLEQRFKQTMERVAELTEEKQKLEHLVLQLQSETETIGEYITLYQKQRAVLQNRARERDQVFRELLEQRNQQQEQLHKLKVLVSDFLRKEYIHSNGAEHITQSEVDVNPIISSKTREKKESKIENKSVSELLDILTEIKDCKDSCLFQPNFHPCPWCSGKLLTV